MSEATRKPLTSEELDDLAEKLSRLEPGFQRADVFRQIRRIVVSSIVEIVPVRHHPATNNVEVLMTRRPDDDLVEEWRGKLHTAGTNVLATDGDGTDYRDTKDRLLNGEIKSVAVKEPVFVGNILHQVEAGKESSQIFYAEVLDDEPVVGEFHPADQLPGDVIKSQLGFISMAVDRFRRDTEV